MMAARLRPARKRSRCHSVASFSRKPVARRNGFRSGTHNSTPTGSPLQLARYDSRWSMIHIMPAQGYRNSSSVSGTNIGLSAKPSFSTAQAWRRRCSKPRRRIGVNCQAGSLSSARCLSPISSPGSQPRTSSSKVRIGKNGSKPHAASSLAICGGVYSW